MSRLILDRDKVEACRQLASKVALNIQDFIHHHTTVSIERAVLRLFGVEESYKGQPLVNSVIGSLGPDEISLGICHWLARALAQEKSTPISLCLRVAEGQTHFQDFPEIDSETAHRILEPLVQTAIRRIDGARDNRCSRMGQFPSSPNPLKYLIIATGNIYEDVEQAKAAVLAGADCIAVIRSTAQSLLDYVPEGATTEGFGGTFATQKNFQIMREAMDQMSDQVKRYIRVVNYSSGLCMPEIAVMGAVEQLDYLLNDSMYGILFRDINMKRTLTDQHFSRLVIARAGIVINTGEDNYLTTAESYHSFPQVLASQLINEQLALRANVPPEQMGLGHAFEMDPTIPDSLLFEIAQAELVREVFPRSPIKYMPPTRHKTGDIFFGHILDSFFNFVGVLTRQNIQLLGMCTEAIHNPLLQDRFIALKSAQYVFKAAASLADEMEWSPNGKVIRRARSVLEDAFKLLQRVERMGLFKAIQEGLFANMHREVDGGRGLDGLIRKDSHYFNPLQKELEKIVAPQSSEVSEGRRSYRGRRPPPGRGRREGYRRGQGRHHQRGGNRQAGKQEGTREKPE